MLRAYTSVNVSRKITSAKTLWRKNKCSKKQWILVKIVRFVKNLSTLQRKEILRGSMTLVLYLNL